MSLKPLPTFQKAWFGAQLDWQRLAADRLEAGLKSTRFVLKTSRRDYFSQSEEKSVQKELSAVYSGVKVANVAGFSTSKDSEKEEKQDTAIEIHITYAEQARALVKKAGMCGR